MNYSVIGYVLRYILCCEGVLMLVPAGVGLIYKEQAAWIFFAVAALCMLIAFPFTLKKPRDVYMQAKEGLVSVALGWIVLSIMGAIPFMISGSTVHFIDALFETVSGFTTTGASVLADLDSLPKCIIFWRSLTHWIGGMGVLVFILTVLPMSGGSHMSLMKAESPGPSVDKLAPKVRTTALILYAIYIAMTVIEAITLLFAGMPVFDAVTITLGTAGTGGFTVRSSGFADYSTACHVIVTVFMILFGVNFSVYYLMLTRRFKKAFTHKEALTYFAIIAAAVVIITLDVRDMYGSLGMAIKDSAFQVGSVITTTGYSTADFNLWPQVSKTVLVMLMFIGACAGSTGGGIKVSRFMILGKSIAKELHTIVHPNSVKRVRIGGKPIEHEVVRSTNVFMITYVLIFAASVFVVAFDGFDLVTNFTAVLATFNNIGPGLEMVGPTGSFADFSVVSKLVFIMDMLIGRLEIFPILILFYKGTWRKF